MFQLGSFAFSQVSSEQLFFPKKIRYGSLSPAARNVPADTTVRANPAQRICDSKAAAIIMDLEINPDMSGSPETARPPIIINIMVPGIFL